jgi:hypothetical protein
MLTVHDETNEAKSTTSTYFHADTESADLIVERPNVCSGLYCTQVAVARFDAVTFDSIAIRDQTGQNADVSSAFLSIALADPGDQRPLAVPARVATDRGSLSVLWRASS